MKIFKNFSFVFILFLFTGCSLLDDMKGSVIVNYNGNDYTPVLYWCMKDDNEYDIQKAYSNGNEETVYVFKDLQNRFLYREEHSYLSHKTDDLLPNLKDGEDGIEKILLSFADYNKETQQLDEVTIKELIDIYNSNAFIKGVPLLSNRGAFEVFYKEYPAYQIIGNLIITKDGYGIIFHFENNEHENEYIAIPSNSKILLYFE